jgi:hypothetical protein
VIATSYAEKLWPWLKKYINIFIPYLVICIWGMTWHFLIIANSFNILWASLARFDYTSGSKSGQYHPPGGNGKIWGALRKKGVVGGQQSAKSEVCTFVWRIVHNTCRTWLWLKFSRAKNHRLESWEFIIQNFVQISSAVCKKFFDNCKFQPILSCNSQMYVKFINFHTLNITVRS